MKRSFDFFLKWIVILASLSSPVFADTNKLFVSFVGKGDVESHIASKGFQLLPVVYQHHIDTNHDGKLDYEKYIDYVESQFKFYNGPIMLDWEGDAYKRLVKNKPEDVGVQNIVNEYVRAVRLLQGLSRGSLEIGFYGFPSKKSTRKNGTINEVTALTRIYDNVQILYPSLYLNHNHILNSSGDIDFILRHLRQTLEIACKNKKNKKIYALVTHRWHPKSPFSPNKLIPIDVFESYIKRIRDVNYKMCKVDGIVWWGADEHWYKKGKKKNIINSLNSYPTIKEYNYQVIDSYSNILLKYFSD